MARQQVDEKKDRELHPNQTHKHEAQQRKEQDRAESRRDTYRMKDHPERVED